ncbi:MAG: dienelactone hydrolase, partial [Chloroflexota bacterium]
MFVAGSQDDVSGYEIGTRRLWEDTVNTDRYLLTFENARHNAGAPMPPPTEVTDFNEYMHYADNVWNSARMNNISQHFVTAFLGIHLKGEEYGPYLDVIPNAVDGAYSTDDDGNFTDEHTYWLGFQDRTALGLSLEFLGAGE